MLFLQKITDINCFFLFFLTAWRFAFFWSSMRSTIIKAETVFKDSINEPSKIFLPLLNGPINYQLQEIKSTTSATLEVEIPKRIQTSISEVIQNDASTSLLDDVETTVLKNNQDISLDSFSIVAQNAIETCAIPMVARAKQIFSNATQSFGQGFIVAIQENKDLDKLLEMSSADRVDLLVNVLKQASSKVGLKSCDEILSSLVPSFVTCILTDSVENLIYNHPAFILIEQANPQARQEINNQLVVPLTTTLSKKVDVAVQTLCIYIEQMFTTGIMSNVLPSLASWENLLVGLISHLVNDPLFQKALDNVAGIDPSSFRDVLLTTDENGQTKLGLAVNIVKDLILADGSKTKISSPEYQTEGVDANISTLISIVLTALSGMKSACLGGLFVTFISLLALYIMMGLFVANVTRLGQFQHVTLVNLFDPQQGYLPSLRTKEDVKNQGLNEDVASRQAAETFTVSDMLAILARGPTRAETIMLNDLSINGENKMYHQIQAFLEKNNIAEDAELTHEELDKFVTYLTVNDGGKKMESTGQNAAIKFIIEVADEDNSGAIGADELLKAALAWKHWTKKRHVQIYLTEAIQ